MKKFISVLLILILMVGAMPLTAFAAEAPKLYINEQEAYWVELGWNTPGTYTDGTVLEKSSDGETWSEINRTWSNYLYLDLEPKKAEYYRIKCYREDWDDENYEYVTAYSEPSSPLLLYPDLSGIIDDWYVDTEANAKTVSVSFDIYESEKSLVDGFMIYKSVNGAAYQQAGKISTSSFKKSGSRFRYTYSEKAPSSAGYAESFKIYPYFTFSGKDYIHTDSKEFYASYTSPDFLTTATNAKKVVIKLKKLPGNPTYKITYSKYNIKKKKSAKAVTISTKNTSYTIKNNSKNYALDIQVTPYWGKTAGNGAYSYSHSAANLLNGTKKKKVSKVKVYNTRGKKTKLAWSETLTKKDKKIIKKFFNKKFKGKNPSRAEMAEYAFDWIHKNVQYAYDYSKVENLSYVDAIFNKKMGQCLQYNGAMAKVLTYLGYEARIIMGYRLNYDGQPTVNHFWCEVKLCGRWYLVETGNEGKNGYWQHFIETYDYGKGYTKNGKNAKDA